MTIARMGAVIGLALLLLTGVAVAHPFHVSYAEAEVAGDRLEVAVRLDAVDLETALRRRTSGPVALDGGVDLAPVLSAYVASSFRVGRGTEAPPATSVHWVGHELDGAWAWLYFELPFPGGDDPVVIENRLLFDVQADQANTVEVRSGPVRSTVLCRPDRPRHRISFHGRIALAVEPVATRGTGPREVAVVTDLGADARSVRGLVDRLAPHARVHTIVLPGAGATAPPQTPEGWRDGAWLDAIGAGVATWLDGRPVPVVLVGHGLGGWVAGRAAAATPARVGGLVLVDEVHPWWSEHDDPGVDGRRRRAETVARGRSRLLDGRWRRQREALVLAGVRGGESAQTVYREMLDAWPRDAWERLDLEWLASAWPEAPGIPVRRLRTGGAEDLTSAGRDVLWRAGSAEPVARAVMDLAGP